MSTMLKRYKSLTIFDRYSPQLTEALGRGLLDLAFMRAESARPDLGYITVATEPIRCGFAKRSSFRFS